MDNAALNEARRHAGYVIPRAQSFAGLRERHRASRAGLIVAAACVVGLAVGAPWLLGDVQPSVYEIVAARYCAHSTPSSATNSADAATVAPFD
jgi:hypothetical protein